MSFPLAAMGSVLDDFAIHGDRRVHAELVRHDCGRLNRTIPMTPRWRILVWNLLETRMAVLSSGGGEREEG